MCHSGDLTYLNLLTCQWGYRQLLFLIRIIHFPSFPHIHYAVLRAPDCVRSASRGSLVNRKRDGRPPMHNEKGEMGVNALLLRRLGLHVPGACVVVVPIDKIGGHETLWTVSRERRAFLVK